jgi:predicted dehydrogenase
VSAC